MPDPIHVDDNPDLYVALLLPFPDGSGHTVVLGVYDTRVAAEARCARARWRLGYDQPTTVIERPLNLDNEGDDDTESGGGVEWTDGTD